MPTALADVQDAVLASLATLSPAPSLGYPAGGATSEAVWIEGRSGEVAIANVVSGLTVRDETVPVLVRVLVTKATPHYRVVRDRSLAIADAAEALVLADHTLGGVVHSIVLAGYEIEEAIVSDTERMAGVTLRFEAVTTVSA